MKKLKIGIIGVGRLGYEHACNIANRVPGSELVAIADANFDRAKQVAEELGVTAVYNDPKALCADPNVEAVAIITNTASHVEMIKIAMDAGKHVFCEKPLADTVEKCKEAEAIIAAHPELTFMLGFMRRYDPSYADAKAQIDAGHIGKPYLVKATGLDPEALVESCIKFSKTSGGIFIDAASHDIDLMRWFLGGEVTEVYAAGTNFKHPEFAENGDTETGMAMLKFDNGTVAFLHVGRTAPHGYHTETEIVGTEAHIRVAGVPWKDRVMVYDQYGARQEIVENFPQRFAEAYLLEMVDFIDCIQKGRKPELTVYDGTKATLVTYAITDSFHSGKPVQVQY